MFMKKKAQELPKVETIAKWEPKVGDSVLTPISDRAGKIIKLEQKLREISMCEWQIHSYSNSLPERHYNEYTVEVPFPCVLSEAFMKATIVLRDGQIRKPIV